MPDVGVQVPPNLADWWPELVEAGATDLGGLSATATTSARGAVPEPAPGPQGAGAARLRADRAALRLPAVPGPRVDGAGRARRGQAQVLELHPAPRLGPAPGDAARRPRWRRARSRRAARGEELTEEELTALFSETRPEVIEEMRVGGRRAAGRAGGGDGDLRRQPQHQLHQRLRRRLRLLRLRPGQALARRLPRRRGRLRRPGRRRRSTSARPRSACRAGSTPTTRSRTTGAGCGLAKECAPADPPARLLADGDPLHVRALRALARLGLRLPDRVRARLDAGDRGRGARRRRAPADLAEQAAGRALGRDHRGLAPRRAALDLDGDVRPHRGAARAGAPHAGRPRGCRSGPAGSPSSSRSASSPSTRCSAAPTGSRRSRATTTSSTPPPSAWRSAGRSRTCRRAG